MIASVLLIYVQFIILKDFKGMLNILMKVWGNKSLLIPNYRLKNVGEISNVK